MNPFDLRGPEFLTLYVVVAAIALILALVLRWALRTPADEPPQEARDLDPYELACLAGSERRAIDAAIIRLVHRGTLSLDASNGQLKRGTNPMPENAHRLEKIVFAATNTVTGVPLDGVRERASTTAAKLRSRLEELGLLIPEERMAPIRLWPGLLLSTVAAFGIIKIFVGASRDRPVLYLLFLVLGTVGAACAFFATRPHRTRRGDLVLSGLKHENAALEFAAKRSGRALSDADLALALGLFGMGILAAGPLANAYRALQPPKPAGTWWSSSCSSGAACGGAGCGGGGGCGGGCGGGGCGGCGG